MAVLDETNRNLIIVAVILGLINVILFVLSSTTSTDIITLFTKFSSSSMRDYILSFGIWAPVIFILLHLLQTIIAPIPGFVLVIAGGLIWGTFGGGMLSLFGVFIGSILCFYISRYIGRPFVEKLVKEEDLEMTDTFFQKYGFLAIFVLRLIPLMAFDVVSYGAGLTKMDFKKYALATFVGMIPGSFLYSYIGFTVTEDPLLFFALSAAVLISFFVMGIVAKRIKEKSS
jgi:uncharacterized membrane protein YdjX (TVP38/TMEM64 family)